MWSSNFKSRRITAPGDDQPMSRDLYEILKRKFGRVDVGKRGELADPQFNDPGEIYKFNCPFCGDKRRRAWVGYLYGQEDANGYTMTHLVGCWNTNCFDDPLRRYDFKMMLEGFHTIRGAMFSAPNESQGKKRSIGPATMPGVVAPLSQLPSNHSAVRYVRDRGFDVAEVSDRYGAVYCVEPDEEHPSAMHRLVIPIRKDGVLIGWQARKLNNDKKFKYYTMPGFQTGQALYGWDESQSSSVVVLCEGVTDVWSIGPGAMALFGKPVKDGQLTLLTALSNRANPPLVVLFLDHEITSDEVQKNRYRLNTHFPGRVITVTPPLTLDPADSRIGFTDKVDAGVMTRDAIWKLIHREIAAQKENHGDY